MGDIIKTILISIMSSGLVFWFGQRTIEYKNKQDNKKKWNKLLFHLLLLKKEVSKLNGIQEMMNSLIEKLKHKLVKEIGISIEEVNEQFTIEHQENLIEALKGNLLERDEIEFNKIKENTAILINELSETNPLFALDLFHFYNVDKQSIKMHNGIKAIDLNNEAPEYTNVLMPEIEKKFIDLLDDIIYQTALKIDNKTYEEVIAIIKNSNTIVVEDEDIDELFNDFLMPMFQKMMDDEDRINELSG